MEENKITTRNNGPNNPKEGERKHRVPAEFLLSSENKNERTKTSQHCKERFLLDTQHLLSHQATSTRVHTHTHTHSQRITGAHTQNRPVTVFPMTAWEFLCSGVTAQCETERERVCVCVCVKIARGAGPEVAHSLERRCLLCSFNLQREREERER